jgi:hypothetical protein
VLSFLLALGPLSEATPGLTTVWSKAAGLLDEGKLTDPEIGTVDRGGIVAKVIDTPDRSEVLSLAIMRVKTTPERVMERFRNVEEWRQDPFVLQAGRVGGTPATSGLESLTLDPRDVKGLARCRVNDCNLRLPAEDIEQFRKDVDWSSPASADRATAMFRQLLAGYAASYLSRGNDALPKYDNNDDPVRIADGLRQLIPRARFLGDAAPDLQAYLSAFPKERPVDAEDLVYWQKEKFWLLNVVSLVHSTLVDRTTPSGRLVMVVSKQLYADHYYEASLYLTAYLESPGGDAYLVSLNRTRADIRPSGFNWIERLLLNRMVRRRLEAQFRYLRQALEAA